MSDIDDLTKKINEFRDARDWRKFHNGKDVAISLSLEVAELLEVFQWKSSSQALATQRAQIEEEIADIFIYALMFCDDQDIDIVAAVEKKLETNSCKYPADRFRGSAAKYTEPPTGEA